MAKRMLVSLALVSCLVTSPGAAAEDKEGRFERFCGHMHEWADKHPKSWKSLKFTAKAGLFVLNVGAAVGNIIRW